MSASSSARRVRGEIVEIVEIGIDRRMAASAKDLARSAQVMAEGRHAVTALMGSRS
ncbi:hypothetical protein [Nonomuraea sp. NPDC049141]|uniref:hypothetical protein n=1 Tax=Nonomuraea sp. NPDC049141 TaxID=3155500 RepID=UPI0033D1486E